MASPNKSGERWKLRVQRATRHHAKSLAKHLRLADREEIRAFSGMSPRAQLMQSTATHSSDGVVFGIRTTRKESAGLVGAPWLLGSDELVDVHRREFISRSREWLLKLSEGYFLLENYVYAKNIAHIRWLQRMGFEFVRLIPEFGVSREPFWQFQMSVAPPISASYPPSPLQTRPR